MLTLPDSPGTVTHIGHARITSGLPLMLAREALSLQCQDFHRHLLQLFFPEVASKTAGGPADNHLSTKPPSVLPATLGRTAAGSWMLAGWAVGQPTMMRRAAAAVRLSGATATSSIICSTRLATCMSGARRAASSKLLYIPGVWASVGTSCLKY